MRIAHFLSFVSFLSLSLSLCVAPVYGAIKDCSSTTHTGHIQSMSMEPAAPVAGQNVLITINYDLDTPVTDGTATYSASLNGFPLSPTTQPLCPDLAPTTPCPIAAGAVHYEDTLKLDDGVHGTIVARTVWRDQTGTEILCWEFTIRI